MNNIVRHAFSIALFSVSAAALAWNSPRDDYYRIKLTKNLGGLDIKVQTFSGPAVAVGLENRSGKTATCSASFVSYPHIPTMDETRKVILAAGKRATLAYPARKLGGNFSTAFVNVNCAENKTGQ